MYKFILFFYKYVFLLIIIFVIFFLTFNFLYFVYTDLGRQKTKRLHWNTIDSKSIEGTLFYKAKLPSLSTSAKITLAELFGERNTNETYSNSKKSEEKKSQDKLNEHPPQLFSGVNDLKQVTNLGI